MCVSEHRGTAWEPPRAGRPLNPPPCTAALPAQNEGMQEIAAPTSLPLRPARKASSSAPPRLRVRKLEVCGAGRPLGPPPRTAALRRPMAGGRRGRRRGELNLVQFGGYRARDRPVGRPSFAVGSPGGGTEGLIFRPGVKFSLSDLVWGEKKPRSGVPCHRLGHRLTV